MNAQNKRSHETPPWRFLAAILILSCLVLISGSHPLRAEAHVHTFVVDSLADDEDASWGDGICATAIAECTLRAALTEAWALWDGSTFPPADLDTHTIQVPEGTYVIEQAPVHDWSGERRGVVAEGSVGARWAGRLRIFRYEIRLWRDGRIPDVAEAVDSPRRLTNDEAHARRVLDLIGQVPTPVWLSLIHI